MSKKVMGIRLDGCRIDCMETEGNLPYRVYLVNVSHRRQIAKLPDFVHVLSFLKAFYSEGIDSMTTPEVISWCESYTGMMAST